jgi:pilus assembly protein CpaE
MAIKFNIYYRSPENGQYLRQVVQSSGAATLKASPLDGLPPASENGVDAILLEYRDDQPELDRWIEQHSVDPKSPPIFLFFPEIADACPWKTLRLGARGCFGYPVKPEEFQQAVNRLRARAASLLSPDQAPRIVTFLGAKGGAGATFLAINAACLLARDRQGQVLLLDLDLQYSQLAYFFDLQAKLTLGDVVHHPEELDGAYLQNLFSSHGQNLYILPAPSRLEESEGVTPDHVEKVLAGAKKLPGFGWIVIDGGHRFDEVTLKAVELSDELVLVATPSIPALSNARKLLELLRLLGLEKLPTKLWLNAWQKDQDLKLEELAEFVGRDISGIVRFDYQQVVRSINEGRPLAETAPRHPVCQDLKTLVAGLQGADPAGNGNGLAWGWLKRFRGKK